MGSSSGTASQTTLVKTLMLVVVGATTALLFADCGGDGDGASTTNVPAMGSPAPSTQTTTTRPDTTSKRKAKPDHKAESKPKSSANPNAPLVNKKAVERLKCLRREHLLRRYFRGATASSPQAARARLRSLARRCGLPNQPGE